jgi:hypothetical protein
MKVRIYESSDLEALKAIHAKRNLPLACMPDPSNNLFFANRVIEKDGQPVAAAFTKVTCEPYLLLDPDLPAKTAVHYVGILADVTEIAVRQYGIEEATVWIPPSAETAGFGKVLESIGFIPTGKWKSYTKVLRYEDLHK